MKICWDNLEGVYLTKAGNLKKGTHTLYEKKCPKCNDYFLGEKNAIHCSSKCSNRGRILTDDHKEK